MIMPGGLLHILAAQYFKSSLPAVGGIRSIRNWITIDNLFFLLSWKIVMITLDYTQIVASNAFGFAREDREQTSTHSLKINQKSRISYFHSPKIRRGPKLEGCAFANFGNLSGTEEEPSQKREKKKKKFET